MARRRRDQVPVDLETTPVMGAAEVERVMGWETGTASVYLRRGRLPRPWAVLACGPIWLARDIWAMAGRHDHQESRAAELYRMLHVSLPKAVVRRLVTQGPLTSTPTGRAPTSSPVVPASADQPDELEDLLDHALTRAESAVQACAAALETSLPKPSRRAPRRNFES